jgi:hypothetical protein
MRWPLAGRVSGEGEFYPVGERVRSAGHLVPVHTTSSAKWLRVPVGQRVIVVPCPSTCDVVGGAGMAWRAVVLQQSSAGNYLTANLAVPGVVQAACGSRTALFRVCWV